MGNKIRVGAKCTFVPSQRLSSKTDNPTLSKHPTVTGTITYVNYAHRIFRVEYRSGKRGQILSECFKF